MKQLTKFLLYAYICSWSFEEWIDTKHSLFEPFHCNTSFFYDEINILYTKNKQKTNFDFKSDGSIFDMKSIGFRWIESMIQSQRKCLVIVCSIIWEVKKWKLWFYFENSIENIRQKIGKNQIVYNIEVILDFPWKMVLCSLK